LSRAFRPLRIFSASLELVEKMRAAIAFQCDRSVSDSEFNITPAGTLRHFADDPAKD
jgi:vacuolar-type H+-ATPase subunit B/Vma2